jgi:hypothetical protein
MIPGMHDRIIDRYLNGEMGPAEERDFRKLLELDEELRRAFETENLIRGTFRKENELIAEAPQESYTHFLATLAAVGTVGKGAAVVKGATGAAANAGQSSVVTTILASGAIKAVTAAITIAALGAGVYFASPGKSSPDRIDTRPSQVIEQQVKSSTEPAALSTDRTTTDSLAIHEPSAEEAPAQIQAPAFGVDELRSGKEEMAKGASVRDHAVSRESRTKIASGRSREDGSQMKERRVATASPAEKDEPMPVISSGSVNIPSVKVETKNIQKPK